METTILWNFHIGFGPFSPARFLCSPSPA
jgi:hypothetical protein